MVEQERGSTDSRVARARQLRRAMTNAERKLWWHLRRLPHQNAHFRRQATIGQYYADFACHHHRLVIEVDGGGHADDQQIAADARRTEFLNARGYRVLRFWNNEVFNQIDGVMSTIHQALVDAAAKRDGEHGASVVPPPGAATRRHPPRHAKSGIPDFAIQKVIEVG
jgi:very-short-patch-repair endonuclease